MRDITAFDGILRSMRNQEWAQKVREGFPALDWEPIFREPSSKTGKYHPPDERSAGGLFLHIHRCAELVPQTIKMVEFDELHDHLLIASIVHDLWKCLLPREQYSLHPLVAADWCRANGGDEWKLAQLACAFHEGPWTASEIRVAYPDYMWDTTRAGLAMHFIDFYVSRVESYSIMQNSFSGRVLMKLAS